MRKRRNQPTQAEQEREFDDLLWKVKSFSGATRFHCGHKATRGRADYSLCFQCHLQTMPNETKRGNLSLWRGPSFCVACGIIPVDGRVEDTCEKCQREQDAVIAAEMAKVREPETSGPDLRSRYSARVHVILTLQGESGSVRRGRVGQVVR